MKKLICLLLALMLIPLFALAEEDYDDYYDYDNREYDEYDGDDESEEEDDEETPVFWKQINEAVSKGDTWLHFAEGDTFRLGETAPLEGSDSLLISSWGTYPSIDGSSVCVPMAMELARQWLNLKEEDLNGFVNFSTTPYAYDRLINGKPNPLATIKSRGIMMDDTHPVDLLLTARPDAEKLKAAEEAGVELVCVPFCCDALVFTTLDDICSVENLTIKQIRQIYTGEIFSWCQVDEFSTGTITAFQRPEGSDSRIAMEEMVMQGLRMHYVEDNYTTNTMTDYAEQVGNYDNRSDSIGYSYLYYVDTLPDIVIPAVNGIDPTPENLQSGAYPLTVNFYAVYRKGDTRTEAFVNWLISDEGQMAVAQAGYIPLRSSEIPFL